MIYRFLLFLLAVFFIIACENTPETSSPDCNLSLILEQEGFVEFGEANTLNLDNQIYTTSSEFKYVYEVYPNNNVSERAYLEPEIEESIIGKDTLYDFLFYFDNQNRSSESIRIDTITLYIFKTKGIDPGLGNEQTLIRYQYVNDLCGPIYTMTEVTGLIEEPDYIFIHPFRSGPFKVLEFSAFPRIKLPVKIGETWSNNMSIPSGHPSMTLLRNIPGVDFGRGLSMECKYLILDSVDMSTPYKKNIPCYIISASAFNDTYNLRGESLYYFNKKYGFIKHEFKLKHSDSLIVSLTTELATLNHKTE